MRVCAVCADTCACVYCRCVRVCVLVCWSPYFRSCFFFSACCCCRILWSISHRPSSSLLCDSSCYYACVDIAYACLCCVCYDTCACAWVRAGLCVGVLDSTFSFWFFLPCVDYCLLLLLLLLYQVYITRFLKLSSSPLCGGHGTTAVARQVFADHYAFAGIAYACVICMR